jgi:hypothetical protein
MLNWENAGLEDNIEEGTVQFHSAVVVNEAQLSELIQK